MGRSLSLLSSLVLALAATAAATPSAPSPNRRQTANDKIVYGHFMYEALRQNFGDALRSG